jgi:hypothetical protein
MQEVAVDAQEVGEALQGGTELPESSGNRRLGVCILQVAGLRSQEPTEIERNERMTLPAFFLTEAPSPPQ